MSSYTNIKESATRKVQLTLMCFKGFDALETDDGSKLIETRELSENPTRFRPLIEAARAHNRRFWQSRGEGGWNKLTSVFLRLFESPIIDAGGLEAESGEPVGVGEQLRQDAGAAR